jgi:citrate synthase
MTEAYSKGLAGVIVADSAVCTVGVQGVGLNYRGYSITGMPYM